jgi:hypothetical protein
MKRTSERPTVQQEQLSQLESPVQLQQEHESPIIAGVVFRRSVSCCFYFDG